MAFARKRVDNTYLQMVLDHDFECKEKVFRLCHKSIKKISNKSKFVFF